MRKPIARLIQLSNDPRISATQFREIIRNLIREDIRREGILKSLDILEQEAIMETERERYDSAMSIRELSEPE